MRTLHTVDDVIKELGGTVKASRVAGVHPSQISDWRNKKRLGAKTYVAIQQELTRLGFQAPASLWGMVEPESAA